MSVVIPAHNEERSIARLLGSLLLNAEPGEFQIIVVCNGCNDATATVSAGFGADVQVFDIAQPSKRAALRHGDDAARYFPRLYIDADVEIGCQDIRALRDSLRDPAILAAAPERVLPRSGVTLLVRAYYDIWERLPQVRDGLFGRGVIAVSAAGHQRVTQLPPVMSDDLALSEAFAAHERVVVRNAYVTVWPPRTLRDLLRRRVRVSTGNSQLDQMGKRSSEARTSRRDLIKIVQHEPKMALRLPVFVAVALASRLAARPKVRSGDFDTWLRDESSRTAI